MKRRNQRRELPRGRKRWRSYVRYMQGHHLRWSLQAWQLVHAPLTEPSGAPISRHALASLDWLVSRSMRK